MSYRSETIATAMNRMNRQYFLPAIQREFVWKPDQIVQLFDSILRGYPISSFLFWELKPENGDKWQAYKFIDRARHGGTHNQLASIDGVLQMVLVLDGQQRLTSLLLGLRGVYVTKKKYKRWDNPDAWSDERLYIDLLAEPRLGDEDTDDGLYYRLAFMAKAPEPDANSHWFKVGRILDFDEKAKYEQFVDEQLERLEDAGLGRTERRIFERNLERLYQTVHADEAIAYYTETDQDYDRVLDIFVRANEGGTKLSKSDLLLSMVTSNWDGVNAREEIFSFVDRLNTELTRKNDFNKDFIMKSCLVLTDLPVAYKVQNFNNTNLTTIREAWPAIRDAVERGVDLANSFGIDRDNLTSVNALIPVIYYLLKNPGVTFRGSTPFEVSNADSMRRWLIVSLLKGAFGRASDSLLRDIRAAIASTDCPGADFPVAAINEAIGRTGLSAGFDTYTLDEVLAFTYAKQQTFLALSLLYDEAAWGTMQFHQDHLFARGLFKPKELSASNRHDWLSRKERLGNLCLLLAHENTGKQDMPLSQWLASRDEGFMRRHLIPEDPALWNFERFPEFLEAREALIAERLKSTVGTDPA